MADLDIIRQRYKRGSTWSLLIEEVYIFDRKFAESNGHGGLEDRLGVSPPYQGCHAYFAKSVSGLLNTGLHPLS